MLEWLRVRNVALIPEAFLELGEGLNVVTGETGAGKSVLLESLMLALGARAPSRVVGAFGDRALVEAGFRLAPDEALGEILDDHGVEAEDGELIVRRELRAKGAGRIRVNGVPIAASGLRRIGAQLAEVFSQGAHQEIHQAGGARAALDRAVGKPDRTRRLREVFERLREREEELERLASALAREDAEREALGRLVEEIESAELEPGEDEALRNERRRLAAADQLRSLLRTARRTLYDAEESATSQIGVALRSLERASEWDPELEPALVRLRDALAAAEDLALEIGEREKQVSAAPERLGWIEDRLALVRGLERRHAGGAGGADALLERVREAAAALGAMRDRREARDRLREEVAAAGAEYRRLAEELSGARRRAGKRIEAVVKRELAGLGMPKARFMVALTGLAEDPERPTAQFRPHGTDRVEFRFAAAPDAAPGPLGSIASGGESSRFFVALKAGLADAGGPPTTVVFDEADSGTSGRIAHAVGARLRRLARTRQVLSVTHLPQVAALGDAHLVVERVESSQSVRVRGLLGADRIEEIARMLAGPEITESARAHARQLLSAEAEDA